MIIEESVFLLQQVKQAQIQPINQGGLVFNDDAWCLEESHQMNNGEALVGETYSIDDGHKD